MINEDGRVMITDFGIARFAAQISKSGGMRGTPAYLSPEQIEGKPTDGRSDLFSLGIVLYQLATGRRPFESDSIQAVCAQILKAKITPATKRNPTLPRVFDSILAQCLARNPADRYANGEILSTALEAVARMPLGAAPRNPAIYQRIATTLRYAGGTAALLLALFAPLGTGYYRNHLRLPAAPSAMYPAPNPPSDPLPSSDALIASAQQGQIAAPAEAQPQHQPVRPKPGRSVKKQEVTPEPKPPAPKASPEPAPLRNPAPQEAALSATPAISTGIPMTIEISGRSSDGTLAVFADHHLVFSTSLASVAESAGEPFRTVCTLAPGSHHLSVALYKADNSLRMEKEGLAELHHGTSNLLAIHVVKHSRVLLLRGTGLEVTWPAGSADPEPEHGANAFTAAAGASAM